MPFATKIHIDIPFFIFIFGVAFAESITTNWIMFNTCYVTLGYNKSECALLGSTHQDNATAKLEQLVEPHVTTIIMTKLLIGLFGMPIMCFFLGPWSDKYGRKPVLLLTIGGVGLQFLILTAICEIPYISPWYILLSIIPLCLSGGTMAILAAVLCYINDITTAVNRGLRIAIFYAIVTVGTLVATISSPYALRALGYFVMYLTTTSIIILAWLIIFLFIEESVQNPEVEDKYRNVFRFQLLKDAINTTFKKRDNYNRSMMLTTLLFLVVFVLSDAADQIRFLYVREKFHWSLEAYTLFNSVNVLVTAVGSVIGIYILHKLLNINESIISMIGFISLIFGSVLFGIANNSWQVYVAGSASCFYGLISPMSRSLVSKLVHADEYGKIFSFLAVCESLIASLGSLMYAYMYNLTLSSFPGAFSLLSAAISVIGLILTIIVIVMHRVSQNRSQYYLI